MKKLFFISLIVLVVACNGINNSDPYEPEIREIKLASEPVENIDGSWTYDLLLPVGWEKNLDQEWNGPGLQIGEGDIWTLQPDNNANAYHWRFTTVNKNIFFRFGHFREDGNNIIWANQDNILRSSFFVENNGDYLGLTFKNGQINKVNLADLVRLEAIINVSKVEERESRPIVFSGANSTGDASSNSKIVGYFWEFDDGAVSNKMIVEHAFDKKGEHNVKLTVKDDKGNSHSVSTTIRIFKMAFPENTLEGGDDYVQVIENPLNHTITICLNSFLPNGNHGKPFFWGTINGLDKAWVFNDMRHMLLNEDWSYQDNIPFNGCQQYEFTYSDWYSYFDGTQAYGVNWDHIKKSKFYDPVKGHLVILVANGKVTKPH